MFFGDKIAYFFFLKNFQNSRAKLPVKNLQKLSAPLQPYQQHKNKIINVQCISLIEYIGPIYDIFSKKKVGNVIEKWYCTRY